MSDASEGDFYVGYLPVPPRVARFRRRWVGVVLTAALGLAVTLAAGHRRPAEAVYEYGILREFRGTLVDGPFPALAASGDGETVLLLAGAGKSSANSMLAGLGGREVSVTGSLIRRGDDGMIEVHGVTDLGPGRRPAPVDLGTATLVGEVVDSKCHLGAMKPGEGPTHRLCALRCLRGGLPPLLASRDSLGRPIRPLLLGPGGTALGDEVLAHVGARVTVSGRLRRAGTLLVLEAAPGSVVRGPP